MEKVFKSIANAAKFIRVQRNINQEFAANEAGISLRSLQNIEAGKPVNSSSLFAYLDYLGLLGDMLSMLPDPNQLTPMEQLEAAPKRRERARMKHIQYAGGGQPISKTDTSPTPKDFQWGDGK